jgi:hypothetical protein
MRTTYVALVATAILLAHSANVPSPTAAKDPTRTYHFAIDYTNSDIKGQITHRQRVQGDYTLAGGETVWANVTISDANGATEPFAPPQKQDFMEGFRYPDKGDFSESLKPDFFKGFPPSAIFERNLVWDSEMFELFARHQFDHLKPNEPYHVVSNSDTNMPGIGNFHNRDVILTRTGTSQRNGQDCAVIEYRAYFNPLDIANSGMTLKGRSHYWGLIWISLATKQIEYATLYEDVLGEMKLPGQDAAQVIDVFRSGVLEPAGPKQ